MALKKFFARCVGRKAQTGALTIDLMFSVIIFSIISILIVTGIGVIPDILRGETDAQNKTTMSTGLRNYVMTNFAAIEAAGGHATVTLATLIAGGYVPAAFPVTDPWGNAYTSQTNVVSATAVTYAVGTHTAPPVNSNFITWSAFVAAYMTQNGDTAGVIGNNAAIGSTTSWDTVIATFTAAPTFAAGSMAVTGEVGGTSFVNDGLYRMTIPGHPEANQLTTGTNLDINSNNLNNIGNAGFLSGGVTKTLTYLNVSMIVDLYGGSYTANGGNLTTAGTLTANGVMTASSTLNANGVVNANSTLNVGGVLNANNTVEANGVLSANSNMNVAGTMTANGDVETNSTLNANSTMTAHSTLNANQGVVVGQIASLGGGCGTIGQIGADSGGTGAIYYCANSGVWTAMGGASGPQIKAWVQFYGSTCGGTPNGTCTIAASYNVSHITHHATGQYIVNLSSAVSTSDSLTGGLKHNSPITTGDYDVIDLEFADGNDFYIYTHTAAGVASDMYYVYAVVIGT